MVASTSRLNPTVQITLQYLRLEVNASQKIVQRKILKLLILCTNNAANGFFLSAVLRFLLPREQMQLFWGQMS